jgi:hypothetical protein
MWAKIESIVIEAIPIDPALCRLKKQHLEWRRERLRIEIIERLKAMYHAGI